MVMSTTENDQFERLRKRQLAAVQCIEALRELNAGDQIQALRTAATFYGLASWMGFEERRCGTR